MWPWGEPKTKTILREFLYTALSGKRPQHAGFIGFSPTLFTPVPTAALNVQMCNVGTSIIATAILLLRKTTKK